MAEINWKSKYNELKAKYMNDVDTAYRLGCEQGMQMAQQQQAQDQAAQQQAAAQGGQPGQPTADEGAGDNGEGGSAEQVPGDSAHPQGSELDQHIAALEGMVKKSELDADDLQSMRKSFEALKFGIEMKKSDAAVKGIAKALKAKSPVTMSKSASANLNQGQKNALTMQEKIVSDIMSQWDQQESSLSKSIASIVAGAGLKKGLIVSPHYLAEIAQLHPVQQAAFQDLMLWGNAGVESGFTPSDMAIESALRWAKQVPIPPPEPEVTEEETPEEE